MWIRTNLAASNLRAQDTLSEGRSRTLSLGTSDVHDVEAVQVVGLNVSWCSQQRLPTW